MYNTIIISIFSSASILSTTVIVKLVNYMQQICLYSTNSLSADCNLDEENINSAAKIE